MKKTQRTLLLFPLLLLAVILSACDNGKNMKVTFVNQTALPVNMFVSGDLCKTENLVMDRGMRKDEFHVYGKKNSEQFEVAVNNQVLVRKSLEWKADAKEIMVVYNGSDIVVSY
jgi:hypothetical protein